MAPDPDPDPSGIDQAVTGSLTGALRARALVPDAARWARAASRAEEEGRRLLAATVHHCYPLSRFDSQTVTLLFDDEREAARVCATLAFGAATAGLLAPAGAPGAPDAPDPGRLRLLGALLNLGIGLLDGLCDEEPAVGLPLLHLIHRSDVADAARRPRARGWLRAWLPDALEADATAAFTADVVETFFALLHEALPGEPGSGVRHPIGALLARALDAERTSVGLGEADDTPAALLRCSQETSVLPFEILGAMAGGGDPPPAAGHLGRALWRIDDLADLTADARSGALNALLLELGFPPRHPVELDPAVVGPAIERASMEAADSLARAVSLLDEPPATHHPGDLDVVLVFLARYAGIAPGSGP